MRIKSYFADSVQEAIEKARVDLGPEAMLLNSKKTDLELRALGSVEVVFGLPGQAVAAKSRLLGKAAGLAIEVPAVAVGPTGGPAPAPALDIAQDLADLRRQIETVKRSLVRQQRSGAAAEAKPTCASENICSRLLAADISEELAQEIAEAVELHAFAWKSSSRGARDFEMVPSETLELALSSELERRFQVCPELGVPGAKQKIVMFVGPAGAGKTTSLIKLGLRYGLQARLPMHILSLDTLRVGGWEHLAAYARIAGLGFDPVHNLSGLGQLLTQHADKKLMLIDTPGFGPAEVEDLDNLAGWAKTHPALDVQMVVAATLRPTVMLRTIERFRVLKPSKLLLTRVDETESEGAILDIVMRSGLPLSYLSKGQTIPDDIAQASQDLLSCITSRRPARLRQEAA